MANWTVQPVFNRDVIAGFSDTAASSLLELEAWINGEEFIGSRAAIDESNLPPEIVGSQTSLTTLESDLISAVTRNDITQATELVSHLRIHTPDEQKATITTAFLRTIHDGPIEALTYLFSTGLVDTTRTDEITDRGCLHEAAIANRLDVLKLCVEHGMISSRNIRLTEDANVAQPDLHGRHALHYACRNGYEDIAVYLLSKQTPPDHPDQDGLTPITMAVISGKTNCVHQLLEYNANVESENDSSIPLNLACQYGHTDIVRLLLQRHPK